MNKHIRFSAQHLVYQYADIEQTRVLYSYIENEFSCLAIQYWGEFQFKNTVHHTDKVIFQIRYPFFPIMVPMDIAQEYYYLKYTLWCNFNKIKYVEGSNTLRFNISTLIHLDRHGKTTTYLDNLIRNLRGSIELYEFPQKTLDDWKRQNVVFEDENINIKEHGLNTGSILAYTVKGEEEE